MVTKMIIDVVGLGEPLVQFNPLDDGPLRHASLFEKHSAGSEANIVIGLSRLGFKTAYITKLGTDEFSKFLISTLKSEDVNISWIKRVDGKNCGVFFVQRNYPIPAKSDVIYFRNDSAARFLSPDDIEESAIKNSRVLHISGITPALSKSCMEACFRAIELARKDKVQVSFDTNYRRKLWSNVEARPVLTDMASKSNILFTDLDEVEILFGERLGVEEAIEKLIDLGPTTVVLKLGAAKGMVAKSNEGTARVDSIKVPVVDSIGAGDAVVVGFLGGILAKESLHKCLEMASCCSALVVMRRGDFENLPDKEYLEKLLLAKDRGFEIDLR
jgi:sugar/nucleoside kinase (ribokinase family)